MPCRVQDRHVVQQVGDHALRGISAWFLCRVRLGSRRVNEIAALLSSRLYSQGSQPFNWKVLYGYQKVSESEVARGRIQGVNGKRRVLFQYRELQVNARRITVGYLFGTERDEKARPMLDLSSILTALCEDAQKYIIASIVVEEHNERNESGGVVVGVTAKSPPQKAYPDPIQTQPPIPPDRSFRAEVYIGKGLPANDRTWLGDDYEQAASVLKSIAAIDATNLPRYGSIASGPVFARIVSLDNLRLLRNSGMGRQIRLSKEFQILTNVSEILTNLFFSKYSRRGGLRLRGGRISALPSRGILGCCAAHGRVHFIFTACNPGRPDESP